MVTLYFTNNIIIYKYIKTYVKEGLGIVEVDYVSACS